MSPTPRQTLARSTRIRAKRDFDRAFRLGLRASDRIMTLLAARNEATVARLGISVSRRFGDAVRRNRAKRLVREAFRAIRHQLPPGTDWVVIPRFGRDQTVDRIRRCLLQLADQLSARLVPTSPASGIPHEKPRTAETTSEQP